MAPPRIDSYRFGSIVIDGKQYTSDVIIYPDRVMWKWWREAGHSLALTDIPEILQNPPDVLVIGQGSVGRMDVPSETRHHLQEAGIEVIAEITGRACETYNHLREKRRVVAALHLTC
jgi:hypothetical protein